MSEKPKKQFVIIYHKWWMDSGYFEEEIVEVESRELAERYASAKCYLNQHTFKYWAFKVVSAEVEVEKKEQPRKLTWLERLTGKISK